MPVKSNIQAPVVRIVETPELPPEEVPQVLREINDRQFGCVLQVLIEAKYKAEAMLRNDEIMGEHGKVTFFQGWVAYSDYIIGSLIGLRTPQKVEREQVQPGPPE